MNITLYYSFYITYAFLVTTGTITFIESLRTNIVPMRHILNLETCISIVAAFFYGNFINKLKDKKDHVDDETLQNEINDNRYVDWMITTPIMLLVLILAFQYNAGLKGVKFIDFLWILFSEVYLFYPEFLRLRYCYYKTFLELKNFFEHTIIFCLDYMKFQYPLSHNFHPLLL